MKQPRLAVGSLTRRSLFRTLGVLPLMRTPIPVDDNQSHALEETRQYLRRLKPDHPSLHFTGLKIPSLRQNARRSHLRYAELLYEWLDAHSGWRPPRMGSEPETALALEECGVFLTNAALAWVISERKRYLNLALDWMLAVCEQGIEQIRKYNRGVLAAGLARSYDWLYHDLTEADRRAVCSKLESTARGLYQAATPASEESEWWASLPLHHDHWIPAGGLGETALALLGEVEDASVWAAWAKVDFDAIFGWLGNDGAWHEGAADWVYAMSPLLWFFSAWQSITEEDPHNILWIRNTPQYRLYHWLPDNTYIYLDDSFRSGRYNTSGSASCHLLRRLASIFGDEETQWLADQDESFDLNPVSPGVFRAPFETLSFTGEPAEYRERAAHCLAGNILWFDPSLRAIAPSEKNRTIKYFRNQEIAILRTGWGADAAVVSLKCGPLAGRRVADYINTGNQFDQGNSHHAHANYGSFTLFARGQYFVIPPGYARRSSRFQNVVSVNGCDFRTDQNLNLRILGTESGALYSYAVADATAAFPECLKIESYRRHLVLLHEGLLVVFDDLRLKKTHPSTSYLRFEWTVHVDPTAHLLSPDGKRISWLDLDEVPTPFRMDLVFPKEFAWEQRVIKSTKGHPLLAAATLTRPEWYGNEMQVLSVFSWLDKNPSPMAIHQEGVWGVSWAETPSRPSVIFGSPPEEFGLQKQQEFLLFSTEPVRIS